MKWFIAILLGFGIWGLGFVAPRAEAACWCANPVADGCQCGRTGTSDYSYDYKYTYSPSAGKFGSTPITKTIKLFCDTAEETRSEFTVKAPICGSSPEILPYCAQETADPSRYSCYGREFAKGTSDSKISSAGDKSWVEVTGGETDNQFSYNGSKIGVFRNNLLLGEPPDVYKVFVCDSGAFGCARGDATFIDPDIPNPNDANFYCTPQRTGVTNPQLCGKNELGSGESRLWFPHLRNISALSTLLQSIFNPSPSSFNKNAEPPAPQSAGLDNPAAVTTRITLHQGKDDATPIVNQSDNNSSLRIDQPAPAPLYNFGGSEPYKQSGLCTIADAKSNPGDDLLGPEITAGLLYTQKYTYEARSKPAGCREDDKTMTQSERTAGVRCCSEIPYKDFSTVAPQRIVTPNPKGPPGLVNYKCGTAQEYREDTKGRIAVFTKTPLIEYIYNTLVVSSQSVFKRLMPQGNPKEFKEIPGQANYSVTTDAEKLSVGGQDGGQPTLNFPHLGSLYEYFLVSLQKALRPTGFSTPANNNQSACIPSLPTLPAVNPACQTCSVSFPSPSMKNIFESAASSYKVPVSVLAGIFYNEGGLNPSWSWDDSKVVAASGPNCQVANCDSGNTSSSGAKGPWQFLPSTWSSFSNAAAEAGVSDGRTPNICNLLDSTFAAAKKISRERGGKDRYDPPQCVGYLLNTNKGPSQSCVWNRSDIVTAARQYLGYCEDPQNPDPRYPPRSSCIADPSTCYQRSVLNIATCLVSP